MIRIHLTILLAAFLAAAPAAIGQQAQQPQQNPAATSPVARYFMLMEQLERWSTAVLKVKEMQKVGETPQGYLGLVQPQYAADDVEVDIEIDDGFGPEIGPNSDELGVERTIGSLVQEVNGIRQQLYRLVAQHTRFTLEEAQREAASYFIRRSDGDHYIQTPDGRWVLKSALTQ